MKAKPKAVRDLVLQAKAAGRSFEAVAEEFGLPVGTVKTWWSRYRKELKVSGLKFQVAGGNETPACVEKKGGDETTHRGLKACHMPGARAGSKKMTFALFKRNLWPPKAWKVPPGLVGGELLMMLQERASAGLAGRGKDGRKEAQKTEKNRA